MIKINRNQLGIFLLKLGLAVTFLYAATASLVDPSSWIGFVPQGLRDILPATVILGIFSAYEIVLSAWLMSSKKTFWAASLAALTLAAITFTNLGVLDIIFRDIGLLLAAISLAVMSFDNK